MDMKEIIKQYLDNRAATDPLFAASYAKPNKSIDECCKFILSEVGQKIVRHNNEQCIGVMEEDADILSLAVHYYDEDNITIKPLPDGAICVPGFNGATYEPTEEDKANAKKDALERLEQEAYNELHGGKKKKPAAPIVDNQQTLF